MRDLKASTERTEFAVGKMGGVRVSYAFHWYFEFLFVVSKFEMN